MPCPCRYDKAWELHYYMCCSWLNWNRHCLNWTLHSQYDKIDNKTIGQQWCVKFEIIGLQMCDDAGFTMKRTQGWLGACSPCLHLSGEWFCFPSLFWLLNLSSNDLPQILLLCLVICCATFSCFCTATAWRSMLPVNMSCFCICFSI